MGGKFPPLPSNKFDSVLPHSTPAPGCKDPDRRRAILGKFSLFSYPRLKVGRHNQSVASGGKELGGKEATYFR
jgi:hypothetical protein